MLTKEALASRIDGREYADELTRADADEAKAAGLIVIYGRSDDLLEFVGAIDDEVGAYNGTQALIHRDGVLPSWDNLHTDDEDEVERYFAAKKKAIPVHAKWGTGGYSWVISMDIPHATFEILDGEEKFCRGIVISVADLPA